MSTVHDMAKTIHQSASFDVCEADLSVTWDSQANRLRAFFYHGYALQKHLVELDIQEEPKERYAIEIKTTLNDSFPPHSCFSNCIRIHVAAPNPQSLQVWILRTNVFKPGIDIVLMNMMNQSERFHAVGWENAVSFQYDSRKVCYYQIYLKPVIRTGSVNGIELRWRQWIVTVMDNVGCY